MFSLGIILGLTLGMLIMMIIALKDINDLLEEKYNAELRAVTHFKKLQAIERKLEYAEKTKEPAVFTVDKIKKEVINDHKSTNNFKI